MVAENVTNYPIKLKMQSISKVPEQLPKLATGYAKLLTDKCLILPAFQTTVLKIEGTMGFREDFRHEIHITLNDGDTMSLRLRGQGVIPMIAIANGNSTLAPQDSEEIINEYYLLQKIYYFEMFKSITDNDEDISAAQLEENEIKKSLSFIMEFTSSSSTMDAESQSTPDSESSRSVNRREGDLRFFRLLQTYVLINNNDELPHASILDQLLETEKFLTHLRLNKETCNLLIMVYKQNSHINRSPNENISMHVQNFSVHPLPFQMRVHVLNMGNLKLNQFRKFVIALEFFGPGKLIAAARSAIKLPCLLVNFESEGG